MTKGNAFKNYPLIIMTVLIALLTAGMFLLTKEMTIFLFGVVMILIIIAYSVYQRRQYEKVLEQVAGYVDLILNDKVSGIDGSMSDDMTSKLGHQLLKLQKIVKAYSDKAEKDKQEIRDLIVEIAHQLRMPIANIDTYLNLLEGDDLGDDERRKYLNAIDISKNKLIFLVESFIKMSRLDSNVIQIRKKSVDLNNTIDDEIENIRERAEKNNICIDFEKNKDISVSHDKNWLGEAIFNLLDNSVKYSGEGSTVKVSVIKNEMFTEIRIEDEGEPLPAKEEHLIFKRFYRGSNVKAQDGFGLGLYLSREIVLLHDGFMKFKNTKNGHAFSIFLPA